MKKLEQKEKEGSLSPLKLRLSSKISIKHLKFSSLLNVVIRSLKVSKISHNLYYVPEPKRNLEKKKEKKENESLGFRFETFVSNETDIKSFH